MSKQLAAVYLRKSTVDAKGIFEEHERNVRALAKKLGATVDPALVFVEDDVSASKERKAETQWGRFLVAVERERPAFVLAQALDRLGRRMKDSEDLDDLGKRIGFAAWTVTEGDLFASPMWPFIAARAKSEPMYTSIRVKNSQEKRRRNGLASGGGTRPYGFEVDRVTVIEAEAAVIREIAQRLIAGERAHAIAKDLNRRGVPTAESGRWSWGLVKGIAVGRIAAKPKLTEEIKARVEAGETHSRIAGDLNRRKVPVSKTPQWTVTRIRNMLSRPRYRGQLTHKNEVVGEAAWEAILEPTTWETVQIALAETAGTRGRPYASLLGGLAMCRACSPPEPIFCSGWGDKAGSKVYKCQAGHGARRKDVLEDHVLGRVLPAISDDEISAKQERIIEDSQPTANRIADLELEIAQANWSYQDGEIQGKDFYPVLGRLRKEHDMAMREHSRMMREFDALNESRSEREHFDTLTHEEQRAFLRRHLHAVEVRARASRTSIASEIADREVELVWK